MTAKEKLESVKIYGRNVSEFLLPDQMAFIERAMDEYADTKQKLNIASVSGKRPDLEYLVSIKQKALDLYDKMEKPRSIYQEGYRDGFIDGADHLIEAACAIGAVDTVAEEEDREIIINAKPTAEYKMTISKIEKITREAPSGGQP